MIKLEFGFGVGLDAAGREIPPDRQDAGLATIRESAIDLFEGCTVCRTVGDWRDPETQRVYSERGMTLSILTLPGQLDLEARVFQLAEDIKRNLNQKTVYVTRYSVESKLY